MKYLVTGAAGFIGFHVSARLLKEGHQVIGIDNLRSNNSHDLNLKKARLKFLSSKNFVFYKLDLIDRQVTAKLFAVEKFEKVIHLAARTGVRYSLNNPYVYADSNLIGHLNILEGCRHNKIQHLLYASSSSVYGLNRIPFFVDDTVDHPISLYAATKKANELMSHTYSHLYNLPTTGLRFFTVYGPWGRPDMVVFKFTKAILEGEKIDIYNHGRMKRDFTYIDDVVEAIIRLQNIVPCSNSNWTIETGSLSTSSAPYRIYNIGSSVSVELIDYIFMLEEALGKKARKNMISIQPGDVLETKADTSELYNVINFKPKISVREGIKNFVSWYRNFYKIKNL